MPGTTKVPSYASTILSWRAGYALTCERGIAGAKRGVCKIELP